MNVKHLPLYIFRCFVRIDMVRQLEAGDFVCIDRSIGLQPLAIGGAALWRSHQLQLNSAHAYIATAHGLLSLAQLSSASDEVGHRLPII
jgi:hypothetical protein